MPHTLSPREGYRLWAPRYSAETAVSHLDEVAVRALGVATAGRALLDVGCGTARRLAASGAALAVGVDLTPEMLERAERSLSLAAADVRALPLGAETFDVVWCRLVIGHVRELGRAYRELARVCRRDGAIVVTDFHPAAAAAGHRRTFRDETGALHVLEHHAHAPASHVAAGRRAGLSLVARRDAAVGDEVARFYAHAGRMDAYERQRGLPLVLALVFRKAR